LSVHRYRQILFTPGDDAKSVLDALPTTAQRSCLVEIYGLTDLALVGNLIGAANRGVRVRVMNDRSQSAGPADKHALQMLADAGAVNGNIAIKIVESELGAIDHLKLIIIDDVDGALADTSAVGYGSYNFSGNFEAGKRPGGAQAQDNVFVVENDPGAVAQAIAKFEHDWQHNKQLPAWQITPTHPPIAAVTPAATPEADAAVAQAAVPHIAEGAPTA
jgi:phosphatidylserine/phosphatidylglycerophosphate/cardiolipin synthase-like enzyme